MCFAGVGWNTCDGPFPAHFEHLVDGVQGLGFGVWGLGVGGWGLGFMV